MLLEKSLFLSGSKQSVRFSLAKRASWALYLRCASVGMNVPVLVYFYPEACEACVQSPAIPGVSLDLSHLHLMPEPRSAARVLEKVLCSYWVVAAAAAAGRSGNDAR